MENAFSLPSFLKIFYTKYYTLPLFIEGIHSLNAQDITGTIIETPLAVQQTDICQ